jgi:cystathionine gamma-synthase
MHFETKAIHSGLHVDATTGAVAPPLHLSTTYERDEQGGPSQGYSYVRDGNPTQDRLEEALAAIDGGEGALAFASGMAAGAALLQALPRGSHVVLPDDCYYGYRALAEEYFEKWGLEWAAVTMSNLDEVRASMRPNTKVLWAETPSNPLMRIADIAALAGIARDREAQLVVDGTFATPALQQPISLGADVVLHSTTKYLGGHTDVQGGALVFRTRDALYDAAAHNRKLVGGVASPFNSWLVLRGIRTLAARMRVHCENAAAVARALSAHRRVEAVFYPGLPDHGGHEIARRQMRDFGGMLSFLVRGRRAEALTVAARTRLFVRATSLGGVESLIEHRNSSEGPGSRTAENLLRLSVGLEHPEDLVEDLLRALE